MKLINFTFNEGQNLLLATLSISAGHIAETDILYIEGIYDESFDGLFYTGNNGGVRKDIDASVSITINSIPIPEPATIVLVGFGLLGVVGFKRKKEV